MVPVHWNTNAFWTVDAFWTVEVELISFSPLEEAIFAPIHKIISSFLVAFVSVCVCSLWTAYNILFVLSLISYRIFATNSFYVQESWFYLLKDYHVTKQSPVLPLQNEVYLYQAFQWLNKFSKTWVEGTPRERPMSFFMPPDLSYILSSWLP